MLWLTMMSNDQLEDWVKIIIVDIAKFLDYLAICDIDGGVIETHRKYFYDLLGLAITASDNDNIIVWHDMTNLIYKDLAKHRDQIYWQSKFCLN